MGGTYMVQIIGTKKCSDTRKAIRYCSERNIEHQFVDLSKRDLSPGEWDKVFAHLDGEELIDENSAFYKKNGYSYLEYNAIEELVKHPELLKTPLIKSKKKVLCAHGCSDFSVIEECL